MSDKLRKQVEVERQQLDRLMDEHKSLLDSCGFSEPNAIELSALATFLHSFYSGIENSLKRVAVEIDGGCLRAMPGTVNFSRVWPRHEPQTSSVI